MASLASLFNASTSVQQATTQNIAVTSNDVSSTYNKK